MVGLLYTCTPSHRVTASAVLCPGAHEHQATGSLPVQCCVLVGTHVHQATGSLPVQCCVLVHMNTKPQGHCQCSAVSWCTCTPISHRVTASAVLCPGAHEHQATGSLPVQCCVLVHMYTKPQGHCQCSAVSWCTCTPISHRVTASAVLCPGECTSSHRVIASAVVCPGECTSSHRVIASAVVCPGECIPSHRVIASLSTCHGGLIPNHRFNCLSFIGMAGLHRLIGS